jgi:RimJ/RimL family protein N-acetyltransferase
LVVGERVYLRPLEVADAPALAGVDAAETETFFGRGRIPVSPLAFERWVERTNGRPVPDELDLAVCLRGEPAPDRMIGLVRLDHLDWVDRTGETGSVLFPAAIRGQGYGPEAKHLLLEYAFDRLGLHALRAHVWAPNVRSAAALAKQGYRPAGRLRWDELKDGAFRDMLVFDVLRDEWRAARDAWRAAREGATASREDVD